MDAACKPRALHPVPKESWTLTCWVGNSWRLFLAITNFRSESEGSVKSSGSKLWTGCHNSTKPLRYLRGTTWVVYGCGWWKRISLCLASVLSFVVFARSCARPVNFVRMNDLSLKLCSQFRNNSNSVPSITSLLLQLLGRRECLRQADPLLLSSRVAIILNWAIIRVHPPGSWLARLIWQRPAVQIRVSVFKRQNLFQTDAEISSLLKWYAIRLFSRRTNWWSGASSMALHEDNSGSCPRLPTEERIAEMSRGNVAKQISSPCKLRSKLV